MKTYTLNQNIPVLEGYDILVAGGGPAGRPQRQYAPRASASRYCWSKPPAAGAG